MNKQIWIEYRYLNRHIQISSKKKKKKILSEVQIFELAKHKISIL